jgi:hypothetical protein
VDRKRVAQEFIPGGKAGRSPCPCKDPPLANCQFPTTEPPDKSMKNRYFATKFSCILKKNFLYYIVALFDEEDKPI